MNLDHLKPLRAPAILAVFTTFFLANSSARADLSAETFTLSYASAISPAKALADQFNSYALQLPQFDISLGSLNSVNLTLTSDDAAVLRIFNGGVSSVNYTSGSSLLTLAVNTSLSGLSTSTNLLYSVGLGTANLGFNTLNGATTPAISSVTYNSGFSSYEGSGTTTVTVTVPYAPATASVTQTSGHFLSASGYGTTYGTLAVTYDYTPAAPAQTPEPGSLGLLALGGVGWLWGRRLINP